jgi:hypothetical protein
MKIQSDAYKTFEGSIKKKDIANKPIEMNNSCLAAK